MYKNNYTLIRDVRGKTSPRSTQPEQHSLLTVVVSDDHVVSLPFPVRHVRHCEIISRQKGQYFANVYIWSRKA